MKLNWKRFGKALGIALSTVAVVLTAGFGGGYLMFLAANYVNELLGFERHSLAGIVCLGSLLFTIWGTAVAYKLLSMKDHNTGESNDV